MVLIVISLVAMLVASLPWWLPARVVAVREWIFARINGPAGIAVPGPRVDVSRFMELYAHPHANGRSRGAALSDLFWYWLSPGAEIHQEHLEPGEHYAEIAHTTRRILAMPARQAEERVAAGVARLRPRAFVRVRDLMMPVWAEFYYETVFGEPCPRKARDLIVGNASDVVTALKCCGLRHMSRRDELTRYLIGKIEHSEMPHALLGRLITRERALYLQGTFFNTAVVQMSEAMAHLCMVLARHPQTQERINDDPDLLDHVIDETLRLYPLFGIAHRVTSGEITLDERTRIPEGAVLCFNYPAFHREGYENADEFDPDRWRSLRSRNVNHIPFGVAANRPCPAWRLAPLTMKAAATELLGEYILRSSAAHTRSLASRGPCILVRRSAPSSATVVRAGLGAMYLRDRWEDVGRSLKQLVLGTYMVWHARRLRLCERHFQQDPFNQSRKVAS